MDKQMPLMEVREALGKRVDAAHFADEATVITKNGEPRAVLISHEWFQKLTAELRPARGAAGADVGQTSADSHSTPLHGEPPSMATEQPQHSIGRHATPTGD